MDTKKVSANRQKKIEVVTDLTAKVTKAKAVVLTNYTGLTHKQLEQFKREIKKADAEFAVTKNRLLKRALDSANLEAAEEHFNLPTGTLFLYSDVVTPLKALAKMVKDLEKPQVKYGLLEGKAMTAADVMKLATLPSREVLLTQLAGMLKSPIQNLHRALSWNMQTFVMTLKAIETKKSS